VSVSAADSPALMEHLFRREAGRMVAHFTRLFGPAHLDLAEDAVQEAMLRALQSWPYNGTPENAAAWLFRAAHNAAIDAVRRARVRVEKAEAIVQDLQRSGAASPEDPGIAEQLRDDELRMLFLCCHPALSRDSSVALGLKTVGGFSVREIARAFLAEETAIAQRLVRAKRQIREGRASIEMPPPAELPARLDAVLEILYFMFNEGYAALEGESLIRRDLCHEALRLAHLVASSPISTPRARALAALLAFQASRFDARIDEHGELVLLEDQDRSRWDCGLIQFGFHHLLTSMEGGATSEYHVQAAIASAHAAARDASSTDWAAILKMYDRLAEMNASPVVELNRAVAIAKVHGAEAGLAALEPLEQNPWLAQYHLRFAVRGRLLLDLGRREESAAAFRAALECPCSEPERRFLTRKLAECC
jgi:RNA polymerase sigma-70 factor (ECF subfamily)